MSVTLDHLYSALSRPYPAWVNWLCVCTTLKSWSKTALGRCQLFAPAPYARHKSTGHIRRPRFPANDWSFTPFSPSSDCGPPGRGTPLPSRPADGQSVNNAAHILHRQQARAYTHRRARADLRTDERTKENGKVLAHGRWWRLYGSPSSSSDVRRRGLAISKIATQVERRRRRPPYRPITRPAEISPDFNQGGGGGLIKPTDLGWALRKDRSIGIEENVGQCYDLDFTFSLMQLRDEGFPFPSNQRPINGLRTKLITSISICSIRNEATNQPSSIWEDLSHAMLSLSLDWTYTWKAWWAEYDIMLKRHAMYTWCVYERAAQRPSRRRRRLTGSSVRRAPWCLLIFLSLFVFCYNRKKKRSVHIACHRSTTSALWYKVMYNVLHLSCCAIQERDSCFIHRRPFCLHEKEKRLLDPLHYWKRVWQRTESNTFDLLTKKM